MRLLLTGASGIVGSELCHQLTRGAIAEVTCVARRASRAQTVIWDMASEPPPSALRRRWDVIVNCAADTRWSQTAAEALRANVRSLESLSALAGPDTHVIHVSTAAVVGPRSDGSSDDPSAYRNMYEWSKACAERSAKARFARLTIVRPPLVIGRRADGHAARFVGMYMLLRGITSSSLPAVIADTRGLFDVVPTDDLASMIISTLGRGGSGDVLTIAGGERSPRVGRAVQLLCSTLNDWRARRGVAPVQVPPFLAPDSWKRFFRPFADDLLSARQRLTLDHLDYFLPYLELTEPFIATHPVTDAEAAIAPSVCFWADSNPRLASLAPRPWSTPVPLSAAHA